jgi:hypothetical protein
MIIMRLTQTVPDFKLYKDKILGYLQTSPLTMQANEEYVMNCFHLVRSMNLPEILKQVAAGEGMYFSELSVNPVPPTEAAKPGTVESLTPLEHSYCEKNKIDKLAFAKSKQTLAPQVA